MEISAIAEKIKSLKEQKNFLILAHNYQNPEVQSVADFIGDSLELCREAQKSVHPDIVLCGVSFMAETAAILNPDKNVYLPEKNAHCTMAQMLTAEDVLSLKKNHPSAQVMCYVNSSAEVKSVSDIICTSSNAVSLARKIQSEEIIFVPDRNLGSFVSKSVPEIRVWLSPAFCYVHHEIYPEDIIKTKNQFQATLVISHPECQEPVIQISDFVGSTSAMLKYVSESAEKQFIVCTEEGMLERMRKVNPQKKIISPLMPRLCYGMKKTSLQSLLSILENPCEKINVPSPIAEKALIPIKRMMDLSF